MEKEEKCKNAREENKELEEEEEEEEEDKKDKILEEEVKMPQRLFRPGAIPKRLIYSTAAGGGVILVLLLAVLFSKFVGKKADIISEDKLCPPNTTGCPKGWFRAFRKCYYLSLDRKSWNASQKACRSLGANLAIFRTMEEMEFLMKRIGFHNYWLGLTNDTGTSSWMWTDGTSPSSWLLIEGAGCARLSKRGISTDSCKSSRNYMCSKVDLCG
ncbi:C-type lectin domain family 2 member E-like [Trichosurus vulpecula]|uniref:C-type lectin domain family 2 member E-like n=1 Tax=Trichosurus vulpecula TaxID=9337 RepID=UPI00186AF737|nr:C-type lectin domain family 2 member E-like [Trichosurus vulpecula]